MNKRIKNLLIAIGSLIFLIVICVILLFVSCDTTKIDDLDSPVEETNSVAAVRNIELEETTETTAPSTEDISEERNTENATTMEDIQDTTVYWSGNDYYDTTVSDTDRLYMGSDPVVETEEVVYEETVGIPESTVPETETEEEVYTTQAETEAVEEAVNSNPYGFTDDEIWEIARITYLENGCVGYYYPTYLTACVIINRYLDWGYGSIEEVIFAPGQYSTAYKYDNWGGGALTIDDMTWTAVYDAMANPDRNPHYQMNGGSGDLYYRHEETGECFYY